MAGHNQTFSVNLEADWSANVFPFWKKIEKLVGFLRSGMMGADLLDSRAIFL